MRILRFEGVWHPLRDWIEPAFVTLDEQGRLVRISGEAPETPFESVAGFALPGFQNAHSHAFQYAMAGLTEYLPVDQRHDDFWSWRTAMYRLALRITPDQLQAIAAQLYAEMLRHGYTDVAEFHYLHHAPNGDPFLNPAEMGERLVAAAAAAGIGLTLIPIFYQRGGFGASPSAHQRRFVCADRFRYGKLVEASAAAVRGYHRARLGVGIHSLRAVDASEIWPTFHDAPADATRHIHIAEQIREVDDCLGALKARPIEWLAANVDLDARYVLVHATHATDGELSAVAESGASVALCPSTEGNLGDGLFSLGTFREHGGNWCIGTDSHVGLSFTEELRLLDYGQRLHHRRRNLLCTAPGDDSGTIALLESTTTGRRAMGLEPSLFEAGAPFDAVVYRADFPTLAGAPSARRLSALVYSSDTTAIYGTMVNGEWRVRHGLHHRFDKIRRDFDRAIGELRDQ